MEAVYFFGEHLRWNLGWSNPNPAGAFVAMWIPWLWALGRWTAGQDGGSGRGWWRMAALLALIAELVLWFLLCKTYSRGALVAVGGATGVFVIGNLLRHGRFAGWGTAVVRLACIGIMLFSTGFFARVDPRFVSQDASAGNRLVLWQGGVRMIAGAPWSGWGEGRSGIGFAHWFQPLEATERYAGMVNSYLHVGVERGLPLLAGIVAVAACLLLLSWKTVLWPGQPRTRSVRSAGHVAGAGLMECCLMGAGSSWLVFLIANIFSTLWIFKNLWWLAAADCLVILIISCVSEGRRFPVVMARTFGTAALAAVLLSAGLLAMGLSTGGDVRVTFHPGERVVVSASEEPADRALFFPDSSVLGDDWGKEIRRLAASEKFRRCTISVPLADTGGAGGDRPSIIIACGGRSSEGIRAVRKFPDARLVLVHPLEKVVLPPDFKGNVSVVLPMLDTRNTGRVWRSTCKRNGWPVMTSRGVGQDIRPVWPGVMME